MKEYRYSGPASGVTLSDGTEILLWPGKNVTLPEEHDYVKVLVALKHLTPVPEETKPASTPAPQLPKRKTGGDNDVKTEDSHGS
ncbi:hypothetical protein [Citrobacter sp. RHBSTW-00325]|uniref:hypothetical protein n=1 Tax=Citrobacter sp. RHBSTW-00325 TaxID=2742644 RepID=UPI0015FAB498|nr:hypothetical protein [Citrobacter sp. RHBSTW-00325]MBA7759329.1 hypothetical protein [Citrobacter sp. RHBSTW-00325]HCB1583332.1 hypothetical protein [Citrobacter braakii]HDL6664814.1 hypothetical protein [Yersinia enterocolitica]